MQPPLWKPPVELSKQEEQIVKKIRKAKLCVFLREQRHELFNEAFQQELANLYRPAERGQPPIAPAMLALALILQASMGISDDEVIEATLMDRRWQLVLDCLDTEQAPFSKGMLVAFRQRLIEAHNPGDAQRDSAPHKRQKASVSNDIRSVGTSCAYPTDPCRQA